MGRALKNKAAGRTALAVTVAILAAWPLAQARTPKAAPLPQALPIISLDTELARDAATFEDDRALVEACRATGDSSQTCLCVTHVMKYELTLSEYKAATRLYGQTEDRGDLYAELRRTGISPQEIGAAEAMERTLTRERDFATRCAEAKAYYRQAER